MLSCECGFDTDSWCYMYPHDFSTFLPARRKRCCSCNALITQGDCCVVFDRYRPARDDIEEKIQGDEINIADWFMCEKCGEIFFNLESLGYCITLGENMPELLSEYWEMTGFKNETGIH